MTKRLFPRHHTASTKVPRFVHFGLRSIAMEAHVPTTWLHYMILACFTDRFLGSSDDVYKFLMSQTWDASLQEEILRVFRRGAEGVEKAVGEDSPPW